jgi:hypothetical protein
VSARGPKIDLSHSCAGPQVEDSVARGGDLAWALNDYETVFAKEGFFRWTCYVIDYEMKVEILRYAPDSPMENERAI